MYRLTYQDGDSPLSYDFADGEVVIGRSPDCQIVLRDFGISRNHAKIVVAEDGSARILDLKSKNGTQVNGVPVVEARLKDGDRILLAKFQLTFPLLSDEDHAVAEAYGAWVEKTKAGRTYMGIQRSTVLVAPDGRIAHAWPLVKAEGHAEDVLATLTAAREAWRP